MDTFSSDTKKPSIISRSSREIVQQRRGLCNKMKEMHYLSVVVLETGAFCERERMPLLVLIKVTFKNTGLH